MRNPNFKIYEPILKDHLKKSDIHPHVIKFGQAPVGKFYVIFTEGSVAREF